MISTMSYTTILIVVAASILGETSSTNPNWVGTYNIANKCNQRTCCCLVGKLVISSADANSVRVQCSFAGDECPSAGLSLNETIPTPNGYTTQVTFMGNLVQITLSEDSRSIQFTNSVYPSCSDNGARDETSSTNPNWVGIYNIANKCDQRTCCCLVGKLVISSAGANSVRVQCSFAGDACPSAGLSLDETIPTPNGYTTQVAFMGNLIQVTLSEDSRSIQFTNSVFPSCNNNGARDETSSTNPNWVGTYNIANKCDQRTCCCPVGKLVIFSAGANSARVQCSFAGKCPSAGLSLDETIPTPNGYTTQLAFLGNPIQVILSEDSLSITLTNPLFPLCSDNGARDETPSTKPDWIGTYNIANKCDQRTCCCPAGKLVISSAGANSARVQCSFAGKCPSAGLSLDETISIPNGYTTQVAFLGNPIQVILSEDSLSITLTNPLFPLCSDNGARDETPSTKPDWIGTYNIANKCDQRTCCCPAGKLVISSAGANSVRVQCSFAGDACPSAGLSLDETIPTPNGYTTQVAFMGNLIQVTLSEDSRSIQFTNSVFPSCNNNGARDETSSTNPNWVGTYNIANKCDQRTCCCPVGKLVISSAGANSARVQCSFAGKCPSAGLSLDETISIPNGYTTQVAFLGNPIQVILSEDSRSITLTNPLFPLCSDNAARDETPSTKPDWIGTYNIANKCDQRTCCCPAGKLVISSAGANSARVQCSFAGKCPSIGLSLDETISIPNGYTTQVAFLGNPIQVILSEDSRSITLTNRLFPSCSDTATKSGAISSAQVNMGLLSLFVGLVIIKQFKM